jgi:sortase A
MLAGISILLFPEVKDFYYSRQQETLIENWEFKTNLHEDQTEFLPEQAKRSIQVLEESFSSETSRLPKEEKWQEADVIGLIEIPKIKVKMPILVGASDQVLDVGAGYLEGTAIPGEAGNTAIAAHRSRTYGKNFNRLGEMRTGDVITVRTDEGKFDYIVFDTYLVKPNNLSVLNEKEDETILTLITCHPVVNPTHRLIVQASLK